MSELTTLGAAPSRQTVVREPRIGNRPYTGLLVELPPEIAERLTLAAQLRGASPSVLVEKALGLWLVRDEIRARRKEARAIARAQLELTRRRRR